jgi:glycosyltransferase involved in cell wall biosynthesis
VTVVFFGASDPDYPRNVVLREALASAGAASAIVSVSPQANGPARTAGLLSRWVARGGGAGADAILVPSFAHRDVPLARPLARLAGLPVLFDPLVSRWDTQVGDLGRVRAGSLTAARLRASDKTALHGADLVLCDTWEHGDFLSAEYGVPRRKLARIPVGADRVAFDRGSRRLTDGPASARDVLEVVYIGGFLPLHGVDVVIDAATLLERRRGPGFARFTLIGGGMTAHVADREIAARGLRSVHHVPRVPYAEAIDALAHADVALGIFGTTAKAARVVPHKAFQALAVGVPLVSRRSRAMAEFVREEEEFLGVPAGDPPALAAAIERLASDAALRARLGPAGRQAALDRASPERIGPLLLEAVATARALTAPRRRR